MKKSKKDFFREIGEKIYRSFSNRILWLLVVMAVLFCILLVQLFELQVIN